MNARDPAKTVIAVKGKNYTGGCYVKSVEIRMSEEKETLTDFHTREVRILAAQVQPLF